MTFKKLATLLLLSTAILLVSCQKVKIKDTEWCADEGPLGADCFHALNNKTERLDKNAWDQRRFGQLCTSVDDFTNWKTAIQNLCNESKDCDYQTQQAIEAFFGKIEAIENRLRR